MKRRILWLVALAAVAVVAAVTGLKSAQPPSRSESAPAGNAPPRLAPPPLPVRRVVLFNSGVGFFQREGEVEGNARVDLSFPAQDVNDLLKSLVLQDLNGGQVSAVSYDSQDPVTKTLQSFALNLTDNPPLGQILNRTRGEKVEVVLQPTAANQPGTLNGTVLGIERQRQAGVKEGPAEVEILNLWCADGLRGVRLADVQRVRFLNPVIESEVKRALQVLAASHDSQKKVVSFSFSGQGKRKVLVGYVVENPVWKTSYRLVLGKDGKAWLQGWAVVENATDEDWTNVQLNLVSGRPISFQMDLYQPLYMPRPVVEPEQFASLRPQTHEGAGMPVGPGIGVVGAGQVDDEPAPDPNRLKRVDQNPAEKPIEEKGRKYIKNPVWAALGGLGGGGTLDIREQMATVATAASAMQLGNACQYRIEKPVSLPRRKAALFPIVNQKVDIMRASIYSQIAHAKYPLHGLRLNNTTGLPLMQGPVTVLDGDSYAGDGLLPDVQPKEDRLISFAIDLGVEVERLAKEGKEHIVAVKVVKGIAVATHKTRVATTFNVKNRSTEGRTVLFEHPFDQAYQLVSKDQPVERTPEVYRFEIKVPPGKTVRREVTEERDEMKAVQLLTADDQTLHLFLAAAAHNAKVPEALNRVVGMRTKLAAAQREVAGVQRRLREISADQVRLRANLKEMPTTAAAYKRYLEKFDGQESEIEKLQTQVQKLQEAEKAERVAYEAFLANLTVE